MNRMFSWYIFSYGTQKLKNKSLLSLKKKETFASVIFGKICYVACVINHAGKLICLHVWLHEHNFMGLIDKSDVPDGCPD